MPQSSPTARDDPTAAPDPRARDRLTRPPVVGRRIGGYWAVTAIVVGECLVGGTMDLLRMAPFYPVMLQLGYPGYLATILGTAKIVAGVIVLAPGLRRVKEWAYAGIMTNMVGAMASHLARHHPLINLVAPATFACLAILSWALRPPARRL